MNSIAIRLIPDQDLKLSLLRYCEEQEIDAAGIVTCVGSLRRAVLRFAARSEGTILDGDYEIISLVGTISRNGAHLHMSIADQEGHVIGGHLLEGSWIRTTAEVILGVMPDYVFTREDDPQTGYRELRIRRK